MQLGLATGQKQTLGKKKERELEQKLPLNPPKLGKTGVRAWGHVYLIKK